MADTAAIAGIWRAGWIDGHDGHVADELHQHRRAEDFERRVPERIAATTVAVAAGTVVGFVTVHGDEVEQLYVAAPARGRGVSASLLDHAEHVIARCSRRAWLAVVAGNVRARRFYTRRDWRDAGEFAYEAQIEGGTTPVTSRRYEKALGDQSGSAEDEEAHGRT